MKKTVYILGINGSHAATAALLKDGEIIACVSEERFTRIKNQHGYPKHAIAYCLQFAGITPDELSGVYIGFQKPILFVNTTGYKKSFLLKLLSRIVYPVNSLLKKIIPQYQDLDYYYIKYRKFFAFLGLEKKHDTFLKDKFPGVDLIQAVDHHTAHAYASYYSNPSYEQVRGDSTVVLTVDGTGDGYSSKVFFVKNNIWKEIDGTPQDYSLGWLYACVTSYLGMKVNEHEYKVMGLAPYAHEEYGRKVLELFRKHMRVEGLQLKSDLKLMDYEVFLRDALYGIRFDSIAWGIQEFTEETVEKLVKNTMKKSGARNIVMGGGVVMNVKANKRIGEIKEVETIYVVPSSGDESTAIGAAYFGYKQYCEKNKLVFLPKPFFNIYLGPSYNNQEIEKSLDKFIKTKKTDKYTVHKMKQPAIQIAKLLSEGKIIARFAGRMEYGARALGNRSILAHPSKLEVIRFINDQIKSRDFWMPFAPVILYERMKDYIQNPKGFGSPFMMFAFDTTDLGRQHFSSAMHQYDYTVRPQLLQKAQNPEYYHIIKAFEKFTGIGGLLNTSFNIHGEPIVCTPDDALSTFYRSGLQYLVLEDFLIIKGNS